jgi:hypothetical protein
MKNRAEEEAFSVAACKSIPRVKNTDMYFMFLLRLKACSQFPCSVTTWTHKKKMHHDTLQ